MTNLDAYIYSQDKSSNSPQFPESQPSAFNEFRLPERANSLPGQPPENNDFWAAALQKTITKAAENACTDQAALAKVAESAVIGFGLSRACSSGGVYGIIGRGLASAMTTMSIGELMHTERLRALGDAFNNQNADAFSDQLGSLLADGAFTTAGGLLGAKLGEAGTRFPQGVPEWPRTMSNQIDHRFGEGVTYTSTARGAVLRLPTGEHYTWHEHRPYFQTNYDTGVTHFGDGSKLTISPGKRVTFDGAGLALTDSQMKYEADLLNDFHRVDLRNRHEGTWQRTYALGRGTILFQDERGYLITHANGATQNFLNANGKIYGTAKFKLGEDGSRRLTMPDRTEVFIDANGSVQTKGIQNTYLHVNANTTGR